MKFTRDPPQYPEIDFAILSLVSAVALLSSLFGLFTSDGLQPIEYYSAGIHLLAFGIAASLATRLRLSGRALFFFIAAFFAFLAFHCVSIHRASIWLDEDYQAKAELFWPAVEGSGHQLQPPLDYELMKPIVRLFGTTEGVLRVNAVVFGSLASALLGTLALAISESWWIALGSIAYFSFQSIIEEYSVEARPVSIGLAVSLLMLWGLCRALSDPAFMNRRGWLYGWLAATFCCLAIGLQPPFLLFALSFTIMVWPMRWRAKLWFLSQWLAALAAYLPIQIFMQQYLAERLLETLHAPSWPDFLQYLSDPWNRFGAPLLVTAIIIAATRLAKILRRNIEGCDLFFAALAIIFFVAEILFFKTAIDWRLSSRYYVLGFPPLILAFAFAIRRLKPLNTIKTAALALIFLGMGMGHWSAWSGLREYRETFPSHPDYRAALAEIQTLAQTSGNTGVIPSCVRPSTSYCPGWLVGALSYVPKNQAIDRPPDGPGSEFFSWLPEYLQSRASKDDRIVLLIERNLTDPGIPELPASLNDVERKKFDGLEMFVIRKASIDPRIKLLELTKYLDQTALAQGTEEGSLLPILLFDDLALNKLADAEMDLKLIKSRHAYTATRFRSVLAKYGLLRKLRQ